MLDKFLTFRIISYLTKRQFWLPPKRLPWFHTFLPVLQQCLLCIFEKSKRFCSNVNIKAIYLTRWLLFLIFSRLCYPKHYFSSQKVEYHKHIYIYLRLIDFFKSFFTTGTVWNFVDALLFSFFPSGVLFSILPFFPSKVLHMMSANTIFFSSKIKKIET